MSEETPELIPVDPLDPRFIPAPLRPWGLKHRRKHECKPRVRSGRSDRAAVGSVIGRQIFIKPKRNDSTWLEAANLWGMVVADPGTMKSPIIKEILEPDPSSRKRAEQRLCEQEHTMGHQSLV